MKLRINPFVVTDLKEIRDYIAEDNPYHAARIIEEIYEKFENIQLFPNIGADLSKRVGLQTDYKYAVWNDYVIIDIFCGFFRPGSNTKTAFHCPDVYTPYRKQKTVLL